MLGGETGQFVFSGSRRHTRCGRDWSSDVCSSDLYWHARGYGLFALNPLGQKVFSNGREALNFTIEPHASATFRYRVLVIEGTATADRLEREYNARSEERRVGKRVDQEEWRVTRKI